MKKHSIDDLRQMQSLPLEAKVTMTELRIRDWVEHFGEEGVYVSFSGGKDSTVLLTIARKLYPNIKACFIDTGLEFPEIRKFVQTFDNVDVVRPKKSFKQVCKEYGFPLISKDVSEKAYYARKYFLWYLQHNNIGHIDKQTDIPSAFGLADMLGVLDRRDERYLKMKNGIITEELLDSIFGIDSDAPFKAKALMGTVRHKENGVETNEASNRFDFSRYKYMIHAPFFISSHCCNVMKKAPIKKYAKQTGRMPITAQTADESRLRLQVWLKQGCNAFDAKKPISNPMSFWKEQDVLQYIYENDIPIAPVYGDVVVDYESMGQIDGQEMLSLCKPKLKTTGAKRTGCMLCGYGAHIRHDDRFIRLKQTHPKVCKAFDVIENSGVTYREAIDWINENNGKGELIKY